MPKIIIQQNIEKEDIKAAAIQAAANLDSIIANIVGSSASQTQHAIKILAQHQKKIIKRLVQIR